MKYFTIIFLLFFATSSCTITQKLFHKSKTVVDSTSHVIEKKDSTVLKYSVAVHSSQTENTEEIVIDFDTTTNLYTITDGNKPEDYFTINPNTGEIKASKVPVKVTIKRRGWIDSYDSIADHSKITVSDLKDDQTHVTKKEKEVTKEVHKKKAFTWLWWLLLLIPAYIIYKNWPKIKAIAVHFITGL